MQKSAFLIQSDTTVGVVSQDQNRLSKIKQRDSKKPFLKTISSFKELKEQTRVPDRFKKFIRRKKRATFIYPNKKAIRVVREGHYHQFLKRFGWMYSTSANRSGCEFDFGYIKDRVDIIIYTKEGFAQKKPSKLYLVGLKKMRRIR